MIRNDCLGIIFSNTNDELLPQFTEKRTVASIPFGGRYRLIDFSLSNLVNAGISKVGIITKSNYNSLLDHLGSGIAWDLDRKIGGLFILPPFGSAKAGFFGGKLDALEGNMTFLKRSNEEYVVLCDSDIVSNIDIDKLIKTHKKSGADITVAYKTGKIPKGRETKVITLKEDGTIADMSGAATDNGAYSLDIYVMRRELLMNLVGLSVRYGSDALTRTVISKELGGLTVKGYEVTEFAEIIYSKERYAEVSMSLLERENRQKLFSPERPVYTKTRDDMPTRYGVSSVIENSLIAGGCVIEGAARNCVIFRGAEIGEGAEISNSIIMQGTKIGKNCRLEYVIIDKAAEISDGITLIGKKDNYIYIGKEQKM